MKIFSLESKKYIIIWSLLIGLVSNIFIFVNFSHKKIIICKPTPFINCLPPQEKIAVGWPVDFASTDPYIYSPGELFYSQPYTDNEKGAFLGVIILDWIFWILIAILILSLIKHFKKKNNEIQIK